MFAESVKKLSESFERFDKEGFSLGKKIDPKEILTDYDKRKEYNSIQELCKIMGEVKREAVALSIPSDFPEDREQIAKLLSKLDLKDKKDVKLAIDRLLFIAMKLPPQKKVQELSFSPPKKIPEEVADDVTADLRELEKCFANGCYRSSIILCGRLLEIALHRKYFDVTNFDILEKNPGIGLGNLIAKLAEKNVTLDPGLTQQIHLINQVRIFSVHKKKDGFNPTREQTLAIILFTIDSLNKLFK